MMKQITTTVCATVLMASCSNINNTEQQVNQQVDELYCRMSQPERIAQLRSGYMDELFDAEGNLDTVKCKQLIPYGIGHFSQYASQELVDANFLRKRVAVVQDWLMHHTPNGIPALFHEEVLSGINTQDATVYPQQIGQACSFNPELAELKTLQTGTALRKMGGGSFRPDESRRCGQCQLPYRNSRRNRSTFAGRRELHRTRHPVWSGW